MRLVLALALAGLRRQPVRWLVLALGIAVASAFPIVAAGYQVSAEAAAVRAAVDAIPAGDRVALATIGRNLEPDVAAGLDRSVRERYGAAGLSDIHRYLAYRVLTVSGSDFSIAGTEDLDSAVRLTSGTLPTSCQPSRCEVLVTSPGGDQQIDVAGLTSAGAELGLVVTGTADLVDTTAVSAGLISTDQPLLLGGSVDDINQLSSIELFGRTFAWIAPLNGTAIAAIGVTTFTDRLDAATDGLNLEYGGGLALHWPADEVAAAADRAVQSARRFSLLGATGAALQLGFCVAAAIGMRPRQRLVARLLDLRGASPLQITGVPLVQAGVSVLVGTGVGIAAGTASVAWVVGTGPPSGRLVAGEAFGLAWPVVVGLAVTAVILAIAVIRWPAGAGFGTRVALDALLVAALGLTVLAVSRDAGNAAPDDPLTLSVLTLVAVAAGLATARCWPLIAGGIGRLIRRRAALPTTLAVLGGERRSLRPSVTAGFLAAAICAVVFAGAYRTSLVESAADQAAYQVPLDVAVSPSRTTANPLGVLDVPALQAIGPGVSVTTVTSTAVGVASGTPSAVSMPLIGVDRSQFPALHRFEATSGADRTAAELASALTPTQAVDQHNSPTIPAGSHQLALDVRGMSPYIEVSLWLTSADGAQSQVILDTEALRTNVDLAEPAQVSALEISETEFHRAARLHGTGEGGIDQTLPTGELSIGPLAVDGADIGQNWVAWGSDQVSVQVPDGAGRLPVSYRINDTRVVITPAFVAKNQLAPLPVAVDPATAALARDGALNVSIGGISMPATVAAVLPRMPTAPARFLVADREAVAALVDRVAPGTDPVTQVWIAAPDEAIPSVRAALGAPPADTATVRYRTDIEETLRADPVATRTADLLVLAALIAMILSAVALAMAILADRSEEADDLVSWEVDGLPPSSLRQVLLRRTVLVAVAGIPLGILGGWLLAVVAVRLISVGAAGASTVPPLQLAVGWGWVAVVVFLALAIGLAIAGGTALLSLREPMPRMPEQDLR